MEGILGQFPIEDKDAVDVPDLQWDDVNEAHLAVHHISPRDVAELFGNSPVWSHNKKNRAGDAVVYGRTNGGRPLVIIVKVTEDDQVRPITGWDMSPAAQRRFLK